MAIKKEFKEDYLLSCPICKKKLWASKIKNHHRRHSSLSLEDFERKIIESIQNGKVRVTHHEATVKGVESGTQKISKSKAKTKAVYGKLMQGGKVSPR